LTSRSPISAAFPYTTLFRSSHLQRGALQGGEHDVVGHEDDQAADQCDRTAAAVGPHGQREADQHKDDRGDREREALGPLDQERRDRKSTRLNSSHLVTSYAV